MPNLPWGGKRRGRDWRLHRGLFPREPLGVCESELRAAFPPPFLFLRTSGIALRTRLAGSTILPPVRSGRNATLDTLDRFNLPRTSAMPPRRDTVAPKLPPGAVTEQRRKH